ncbi:MAG: gamma-glutamyl-phosphate reductase, partial [Phycisphaerae bacterium]
MTTPEMKMAEASRRASRALASCPTDVKNDVLLDLAGRLEASQAEIVAANARDLEAADAAGIRGPKFQRLRLSVEGVEQMAAGLRQVASLDDPVGVLTKDYRVPSGLQVRKVRCPIGVILMIYEARPNVTVDAFALCFKAGNACFLKGGKEAQ